MKKILSIFISVSSTFTLLIPFNSIASTQDTPEAGILKEVIESFGEGTLTDYSLSSQYNNSAVVFTADYNSYSFTEYYKGTNIIVRDGAELPLEEINERITPYSIKANDNGGYTLGVGKIADRSSVYETIMEYDDIVSIRESYTVGKTRDDLWSCTAIAFDTESSSAEIINMFPELELTESDEPTAFEGYDFSLVLSESINHNSFDEQAYTGLKKLMESGIEYKLLIEEGDLLKETYYTGIVDIFTAEVTYGDLNNNGSIDMSDAVALMANVSNPEAYPLTDLQLLLADVCQQGDGVGINDAVAVQKYLTKQIDSLPESTL